MCVTSLPRGSLPLLLAVASACARPSPRPPAGSGLATAGEHESVRPRTVPGTYASTAPTPPGGAAPRVVVVHAGMVIDGVHDEPQRNVAILIEANTITAVGAEGTCTA